MNLLLVLYGALLGAGVLFVTVWLIVSRRPVRCCHCAHTPETPEESTDA